MVKNPKNVLLGMGNLLRSDDGAGSYIAQHFNHQNWFAVDGGSAPENVTSAIKRIKPELLVIVDAAHMNLDAGSLRIIPLDKIICLQLSTHSMPLHFLIEYLNPYCQKIIVVGIQPYSTKVGQNLSEPVLKGCHLLIDVLKRNFIKEIKKL